MTLGEGGGLGSRKPELEAVMVRHNAPEIGPETRKRLLGRFGSVENIRETCLDDLRSVEGVGEKTAETLKSRL